MEVYKIRHTNSHIKGEYKMETTKQIIKDNIFTQKG